MCRQDQDVIIILSPNQCATKQWAGRQIEGPFRFVLDSPPDFFLALTLYDRAQVDGSKGNNCSGRDDLYRLAIDYFECCSEDFVSIGYIAKAGLQGGSV